MNPKKELSYFSEGKNKRCAVTIKILFVSRVVQGICWHFYIWLTLIAVRV
jgi:hypothetical protein